MTEDRIELDARVARLLHLTARIRKESSPPPEIPTAAVQRAVRIVDQFLLSVTMNTLGLVGAEQLEQDAQCVLEYAREITKPDHRLFERRALIFAWREWMSITRLDAALDLLQRASLVVPHGKNNKGGKAQYFALVATLYDAS